MSRNKLAVRFNTYTIGAVYFLILVGGIVRSTGAGMGCPDWPKCFGSYIPPADASELPENYESYYVESRTAKNARLSGLLDKLGFEQLASDVINDPSINETTVFDTQKAWVEYINRLIGVLIGFLIIINMVLSFKFRKQSKWIPILGVSGFILVVFQGWIGSLVVSTNLLPGFISIHMALALLLVVILLVQKFLMTDHNESSAGKSWITALLILFTIQIFFGTQVREQIDSLNHSGITRSSWIDKLGVLFYIHRSYSLLLIGLVGWIVYRNYKSNSLNILHFALVGVLVLEILLGIIMAYFSVPAFAQPSHLFLGTIAFGVIFYLFLMSNFKRVSA